MKNICEWKNCKENGEFKAPLEKDNSKKFRWLCEEHIKLFNKSWNYFEGMEQNQIEQKFHKKLFLVDMHYFKKD